MNRSIYGSLWALALAGCSTVPELPSEDRISPARVVDRVQCELSEVIKERAAKYPWLKKWGAGFTLTLRVDEQASITPAASSLVALAGGVGGDLFGAGASANYGGTAKRIAQMTFRVPLKDAANYKCPSQTGEGLEGRLGIGDWLDRALGAMDKDDLTKRPKSIGYTIEFLVTKGGKASADVTLLPVRPPGSFGLGLAVTGQRSDTHTLDIAFADGTPPDPQKVIVVNLDKAGGDKKLEGLLPGKATAPRTLRIPLGGSSGPDAIERQLDQLQFRNELRR